MKIDAFLILTPDGAVLSGESGDSVFTQKIEIAEFKTGGGNSVDEKAIPQPTGGRRGQSYCPFGFEIKKELDATSPHLFRAYCTTFSGRFHPGYNLFKEAEVSFRKAGGTDGSETGTVYLKLVFKQVVLSGYSFGTSANGKAYETLKFAFQSGQVQYQEQTPVGGTQPAKELKGWDFVKNAPN